MAEYLEPKPAKTGWQLLKLLHENGTGELKLAIGRMPLADAETKAKIRGDDPIKAAAAITAHEVYHALCQDERVTDLTRHKAKCLMEKGVIEPVPVDMSLEERIEYALRNAGIDKVDDSVVAQVEKPELKPEPKEEPKEEREPLPKMELKPMPKAEPKPEYKPEPKSSGKGK